MTRTHHQSCNQCAVNDSCSRNIMSSINHFIIVLLALSLLSLSALLSAHLFDNDKCTLFVRGISKQQEALVGVKRHASENKVGNDVVRVLFGASGDDPGFILELEVALKSILLNAPLDHNLSIHYLADQAASDAVLQLLRRIDITNWQMRNKLTILVHHITQSHIEKWRRIIDDFYNEVNASKDHFKHSIGAYFRLFAHDVLPKDIKYVIYMDSDVVIMANLQEFWRHKDQSNHYLFQWGQSGKCSGFLIMNVQKLPELWDRFHTLHISSGTKHSFGDQRILRTFNQQYPELVGTLPREWDISAKNGFQGHNSWSYEKATTDQLIQEFRGGVGMYHFNGGGSSKTAYFEKHKLLVKHDESFGLARYYIHMQWSLVRFMAESKRRDDSFYFPTVELVTTTMQVVND